MKDKIKISHIDWSFPMLMNGQVKVSDEVEEEMMGDVCGGEWRITKLGND